jgi:flavin-dependent dehydrogenase
MNTHYDVLIIGGGPAGSSAATFLARKGFSVLVMEKEKFPRDHVGESLIPFCYGKMEKLGVLPTLERIAVKKPGINFVHADGIQQATWCFSSTLTDKSQVSYHMLRSTFDKMLLNNSREAGAKVLEEFRVQNVKLDGPDGGVEAEGIDAAGKRRTFTGRFILDASGQNSFLASKVGKRVPYDGLDRVAFFSHWSGNVYDPALQEGLIKIVYLGGEKTGWCWMIPVGRDLLSVGVSMNNSYVREKKKEYAQYGDDWKTHFYQNEIMESPAIQKILKGERTHDVIVMGDYSYKTTTRYGSNFALIGDAAAFLDPIFSSGIYMAFESADRVSDAVEQLLTKNTEEGLRLMEANYADMDGAYKLLERLIRLFYTPDSWNFGSIGSEELLQYHKFEAAYTIFHNLFAGDFFTNHRKYTAFLEELERTNQYDKYVAFARSRNERHISDSCGDHFLKAYESIDETLLDLPKAIHE